VLPAKQSTSQSSYPVQNFHFAKQIYRLNKPSFSAIPCMAMLTKASCSVRYFSKVCRRIPLGFHPFAFKMPGCHPSIFRIYPLFEQSCHGRTLADFHRQGCGNAGRQILCPNRIPPPVGHTPQPGNETRPADHRNDSRSIQPSRDIPGPAILPLLSWPDKRG